MRHRVRERYSEMDLESHPDASLPSEPVDWLTLLDQEINRLSERERLPIVFCDLMRRSRREAAAELGLSEGTLSSRLARARGRLRTRLVRRGVVPAIAAPDLLIESISTATKAVLSPNVAHLVKGVIQNMYMSAATKMFSMVFGLAVIAGLVIWVGFPFAAKPAANDDVVIAAGAINHNSEPEKPKTDRVLIQGILLAKEKGE
jgi:predicted DNA-binding protein (UPF0251 family)